MDEALIVGRFIHFAAVFALFGGAAFREYGLAGEPAAEASGALDAFDAWFGRIALAGAIVALLSAIAMLAATTGMMAGSPAPVSDPAMIGTVLSQTEFGHVWCGRLLLALMLIAACAALPLRRRHLAV